MRYERTLGGPRRCRAHLVQEPVPGLAFVAPLQCWSALVSLSIAEIGALRLDLTLQSVASRLGIGPSSTRSSGGSIGRESAALGRRRRIVYVRRLTPHVGLCSSAPCGAMAPPRLFLYPRSWSNRPRDVRLAAAIDVSRRSADELRNRRLRDVRQTSWNPSTAGCASRRRPLDRRCLGTLDGRVINAGVRVGF